MDAAECLSNLYTEVNNLIQDGQLDTPWTPLFQLSEDLHELLLCHQCEHLITNPFEIRRAKCRHLVCEGCINVFSECKPCSTKERRVVECKQLKLIVSGYRCLCKYIKTSDFFRDSVSRDCTKEKLLFISRVVEGASDLETRCTTSVSNGIIENINNNEDALQLEPLLSQEEKAEIKLSGQENECATGSEDFSDSRSNSFVSAPVTPKECVTLQEAAIPQELVSETDFDSSKEMETVDCLVHTESLKLTVGQTSSIEVMNHEESVTSEESAFIDELMSADEVICSESSELNDVNSEDLMSSKECRNTIDVVSSNGVLKMEVGSLKELNTSIMCDISPKEASVLDDVVSSLKGSLSSNENIVNELISSNEAVANQLVPLEELYPSKDYETLKILMSTEDQSSLSDSEEMEMTVISEESNYSKGEGIDEELVSSITLKRFNDRDTKEELVINDINPSNSLEAMDMTVFSEKLNVSNDIKTENTSIPTTKLNVLNSDNLKMLEPFNELEDIITKEGLVSSNELYVFNGTKTAEELDSSINSKNSNDDTEIQYMSSKELNAFNNVNVTEESASSKELNDFMPKGLFLSPKELNAFKEVESMERFESSEKLNNSIDSTIMVELMPSKNLTPFSNDEFMEELMFLKETDGDHNDMSKEGSSSKVLNLFNKETMGECESSKELKDPSGDSMTEETINGFNDVVILEGLLSSKESNEMLQTVSSKDINSFVDEGNGKDYPTELNSMNDMRNSVPCSSLKESLKQQSNSLNDGMSSVETVTGDELLSLNSSDISIESVATGQNFNLENSTNNEKLYFTSGPSTSASVKRKLEDLCEKPIDNNIGSSVNDAFISRCSSPEIECTFSTLEIKNLDHCGCNSDEKQFGQSLCRSISCPCYLNDRACGSHCFCIDCRNPIDPRNANLKKFIMQNVYKYGFLTSDVNLQVDQQCDKSNNLKTSETLRRKNYINLKNSIEAVKLNVGKFPTKPPIINCNPSSNNPELFDFSRANIQRLLFNGYGVNGDKPGFVFNHSPSGKIVRGPNRELWRRIDLINRKAIELAAVNPALIAYYIDLNSQSASGPSHQNVIKRV